MREYRSQGQLSSRGSRVQAYIYAKTQHVLDSPTPTATSHTQLQIVDVIRIGYERYIALKIEEIVDKQRTVL